MIADHHYPFTLPDLPYAYDALEPHMDEATMHYHHDKHFKTYVDNLNKALSTYPSCQGVALEELLYCLGSLPEPLRTQVKNNGGGVYNHDLYFDMMTPYAMQPEGKLAEAIQRDFGGVEEWEKKMKEEALAQFGSGYAWLVSDAVGKLSILHLPNQDSPLTLGYKPILGLDVWEHAYYLKNQNRRNEYIDSWMNVINWKEAGRRYS